MQSLKLYISGESGASERAKANLAKILAEYGGQVGRVSVIDVLEDPDLAAADGVSLTPTLVRDSAGEVRQMLGDLSDRARLLRVLGLNNQVPRTVPQGEQRWQPSP